MKSSSVRNEEVRVCHKSNVNIGEGHRQWTFEELLPQDDDKEVLWQTVGHQQYRMLGGFHCMLNGAHSVN